MRFYFSVPHGRRLKSPHSILKCTKLNRLKTSKTLRSLRKRANTGQATAPQIRKTGEYSEQCLPRAQTQKETPPLEPKQGQETKLELRNCWRLMAAPARVNSTSGVLSERSNAVSYLQELRRESVVLRWKFITLNSYIKTEE